MKNQVQLITYADRLGGGGLKELAALLDGPFAGLFGGVHVLPFFTPIDGADAGFDPVDHTSVDARLGDWADVAALARRTDVMADVIVNHISADAPQFRDFIAHGDASRYAGMFLTPERVFGGAPSAAELAAIYRPRPGQPFTDVQLAGGEWRTLWTTFTARQIDIDVLHPEGSAYLERILERFAAHGIRMVRLDAVGYAIKQAGTSCFMLPQTLEFIADFAARAARLGIETLVEVHSHFSQQIEIARHVDFVYDFALPPLLLHAFAFGTARPLLDWIAMRPRNAITVLDTHDGIGIIDIGADTRGRAQRTGLVPPAELDALVESIHVRSGDQSRLATGAAASNLDLYQVNCTYFDALGRDARRYLLARAVQFFLPGIPQVYYVGLLAGGNDMEELMRSGVGRDINRHRYSRAEIDSELHRPVVRGLLELIRLRNTHPAFGGRFECTPASEQQLCMRWRAGAAVAQLCVDFRDASYSLALTDDGVLRERQLEVALPASSLAGAGA